MEWWVRWGPHLKNLQKIAEDTGEVPTALENYPAVPDAFQEYCSAFMILSSRRSVGMAENPITLNDIRAYVDLFDVPVFGVRVFVNLISKMDAKYLEVKKK